MHGTAKAPIQDFGDNHICSYIRITDSLHIHITHVCIYFLNNSEWICPIQIKITQLFKIPMHLCLVSLENINLLACNSPLILG